MRLSSRPPAGHDDPCTRNTGDPARPRLVIEFADTGAGIVPSDLGRIFDPFQQGTTDAGRIGGLGLGLSISRGIVEGHGGTLTAESPGPGRGATFRVDLDALPGRSLVADVASSDAVFDRGRSLKILLVEDEPETLDVFARILRGLGHRVATATTLTGAVNAAGAGEFDLVISDVGLPDGSGLDLPGRLEGRCAAPAIAVEWLRDEGRRPPEPRGGVPAAPGQADRLQGTTETTIRQVLGSPGTSVGTAPRTRRRSFHLPARHFPAATVSGLDQAVGFGDIRYLQARAVPLEGGTLPVLTATLPSRNASVRRLAMSKFE